MFMGKSPLHVNQDIGKHFSTSDVRGYYNNLKGKVTIEPNWVDTLYIPKVEVEDGICIEFPVAIFQYALGCYDLYIETKEAKYLNKFLQLAKWTSDNQDVLGRWDNFSYIYPDNPYGAMAQGEAVSVMVRAYIETNNKEYLEKSRKAIDFMLLPLEEGGTTYYKEDDVILMEYTHLPVVLNGWIFAWWGLYDYVKVSGDKGIYELIMQKSLSTLIKYLPRFRNNIWSKYDLGVMIASPFYHNLHIAQMQAMSAITKEPIFYEYAKKWENQYKNPFVKLLATTIKAYQKITE